MRSPAPRPSASDDWNQAVGEFCRRLEQDYQGRIGQFAKGIDCWGNSTTVGFEVRLGEGRAGPLWGNHVKYAKRVGLLGVFGRRVQTRDLTDIERQFRHEIDEWLLERAQGR